MRSRVIGTAALAAALLTATGCGRSSTRSTRATTTPPPVTATTTAAVPSTATATTTATATPTTTGPKGGPVPQGFAPASVTFVSASEGFVLGTAPCSQAPCTSVLRTTDGGRSWAGIPAPRLPLQNRTGQGVHGLRFADPATGYAYGSVLAVTRDGGASWHLVTVPGLSGKASIDSLVASGGRVYAAILEADGGGQIVTAAPGSDSFVRVSGAGFGTLTPAGDTVIDQDLQPVNTAQTGVILAGGAVRGHVTDPDNVCHVGASSAKDLLASCGQGAGGGSMGTRHEYGSTDAGAHWTRLPDSDVCGGFDGYATAVTTDRHAVIAASSSLGGSLCTTTDGGQHWTTTLHPRSTNGEYFTGLGFTTPSQAVAVYAAAEAGAFPPKQSSGRGQPPTLYLSRDGGVHWAAVAFRS